MIKTELNRDLVLFMRVQQCSKYGGMGRVCETHTGLHLARREGRGQMVRNGVKPPYRHIYAPLQSPGIQ